MVKANKKKSTAAKREVVYPKFRVKECVGDKALTVKDCKRLLDWEPEKKDKVKFSSNFLFKDNYDTKIRCHNNVTNRPLYPAIVATLKQEHLRRRWRVNGEPIIIGKSGLVLNGQHTLISLILAAQEVEQQPDKWKEYWKDEPTMEKLVVFGVDESDETVNTMDTCKPRSLADVIYRSEFFAGMATNDRKAVARMTDYAVRFLWQRTGAGLDAFAPRRTHSESLDFIARHPRILAAVKHIHTESEENKIARYVSPGYASALLYLMGSSTTNPEDYRSAAHPNEKHLDWKKWEDACDFWVNLAGGDISINSVRQAMKRAYEDEEGIGNSVNERIAVLVKAWLLSVSGKPITDKALKLDYEVETHEKGTDDEWQSKTLNECPIVGGIDYGDTEGAKDAIAAETDPKVPTEEEIATKADAIRKAKAETAAKAKKNGTSATDQKLKTTGKAKPGDWRKPGKIAWIKPKKGDAWCGRIVSINHNSKVAVLKVETGHKGAGSEKTVRLASLLQTQPK